MKKQFSKAASLLTAVIMLVGMLRFGAFAADENAYSNDFNAAENQTISDAAGAVIFKASDNKPFPLTFESGLGGKSADDYSLVETVNDSAASCGMQLLKYADWEVAKSKSYPRYVYKMNVMYSGEADELLYRICTVPYNKPNSTRVIPLELKIRDGKVTLGGADTGISCKKDEWLRIVLDLNTNTEKGYIYINGNKFEFSYYYVDVLCWMQLTANFSAAGDGSRTAKIIVDDVEIWKDSNTTQYEASADEKVNCTLDSESGIQYNELTGKLSVPENADVSALLSAFDVNGGTAQLFTTAEGYAEKTSGTVEAGDVVVLKSADGKTFEYFTVEIGESEVVVDYGDIAYESDFNSAEQQNPTTAQIKPAYTAEYRQAVGGRDANDSSMIETFPDSVTIGGLEVPSHYAWVNGTAIGSEATTLELSMLYDGAADYVKLSSYLNHHPSSNNLRNQVYEWVKIEGGKVYVNGTDTGISCKKGEWLRAAVELHYGGSEYYVYVNGRKFTVPNGYGYIRINRWTQLQAGVNAAGDGSKNIIIGVDDIKVYNRAYTPTGKETVSYTVSRSGAFDYIAQAKAAIINDGTTVADLLNAVVTDNTNEVHKSLSGPTVLTEGMAADGNVVVIKSADGKTFDYLHATTSQDCRIIFSDSMSASSSFTNYGTGSESVKATEAGLYTKDEGDYSYQVRSDVAAGQSLSYRSEYMTRIPASLFDEDSFTYEFSIAYEGDISEVSLANFVSDEQTERFAYNNPVKFSDGKIYVNDNGKAKFIRSCREKEWYRIGITYYPKELKQDIYVNGKKYISKGYVVDDQRESMRDPSQHKLTGFYWNQISVKYPESADKVRSGKVSVDDALLYYGEHFDTADYQTSFEAFDYVTGGSFANDVYLDSDGIELGDFAAGISFDENNPPVFYTDNTYTEQAETVNYGTTIVCTSPNGMVKEYYVILSPTVTIDNKIKCFVNNAEKKTFDAKAEGDTEYKSTLSASANAFAPAYANGINGCLVIAVYKDGILQGIVKDSKEIKSDTRFSVSCDISETDGITAKAMFMESLNSLKAYAPSEEFTVQTAE